MPNEPLFPEPRFIIDGLDEVTTQHLNLLESRLRDDPQRFLPFVAIVANVVERQEIDDSEELPTQIDDHEARHLVDTLVHAGRHVMFDDDTEDRLFEDPDHAELILNLKSLNERRVDEIEVRRELVLKNRLNFFLRSLISWQEIYPKAPATVVPITEAPDDNSLRTAW